MIAHEYGHHVAEPARHRRAGGQDARPGPESRLGAPRAPGRLLRRRRGPRNAVDTGLIETSPTRTSPTASTRRPRSATTASRSSPGPGRPGDVDPRLRGRAAPEVVPHRLRAGDRGSATRSPPTRCSAREDRNARSKIEGLPLVDHRDSVLVVVDAQEGFYAHRLPAREERAGAGGSGAYDAGWRRSRGSSTCRRSLPKRTRLQNGRDLRALSPPRFRMPMQWSSRPSG